jgi:hypothetical protein
VDTARGDAAGSSIDLPVACAGDRLKAADVTMEQAESLMFVVELSARILKNFASACFCVATLRADVASVQQLTVASYG